MTPNAMACMRKALPAVSNQILQSSGLPRIAPRFAAKPSLVAGYTGKRQHSSSSTVDSAHKVHVRDGMASPNTVGLPRETEVGNKRFADFDLMGRTFIVTGGAQGLGLATAEGLVEAGARGEYEPPYAMCISA
jgi:hypothetical protein